MYQTISETISVSGVFENGSFAPQTFHWRQRTYSVEAITSSHTLRDGGVLKRRYAVLSSGNLYLLEYNRSEETWTLEQIWIEG